MKYCCTFFRRLVDNAGDKGMAAVHVVYMGSRAFWLQSRPFDKDVYEYHSQIIDGKNRWPSYRNAAGKERSINIVTNQALHFCPHCGQSLNTLIAEQTEDFDKLSIKQTALWK